MKLNARSPLCVSFMALPKSVLNIKVVRLLPNLLRNGVADSALKFRTPMAKSASFAQNLAHKFSASLT